MSAALAELRMAVQCARTTGSAVRLADVLATYGATLAMAGRTELGLRHLDQAVSLSRGPVRARVRLRRAHVLGMLGRHDEALRELQSAIQATRRNGDVVWEARSLNNRSLVHLAMGAFNRAEADAIQAERLFAATGQQLESVQASQNRALVELGRGNLPRALSALDATAERYRDLGVQMPDLDMDRARTFLAAGLNHEAVTTLEQSLQQTPIQPTKLAELTLAAAAAAQAAGDSDRSLLLARRAGTLFRQQHRQRWETQARFVAVQASFAAGQRDRRLLTAVLSVASTLAALRAEEAPFAYLLAGQIAMARGDRAVAQQALTAAARYRTTGPPLSRASGWLALALLAEERGRPKQLLAACRQGLTALDQHRLVFGAELRAYATQHGHELTVRALTLALRRGRNRELLRWVERYRATAVMSPALRPDDPELARDLVAYRHAARRVNEALAQGVTPGSLQRERDESESAVRLRRRHESGDATTTPPLDVAELLDTAGTTRLIVLVEISGTLHALTTKNRRVTRRTVGPIAAALREVDFARFALRRMAIGRAADSAQVGASLEQKLLGRARPDGEEPVVVIPPSTLHQVPWGLLPSLSGVPLAVAPSAALWLRAVRRPVPAQRRVTLVVGPHLASGNTEAEVVQQLHLHPTVLTGTAATVPETLAALDGTWLSHIAAHGTFRADSPLFSALQLYDGPLTIHDLDRLRRPPHTFLLPACDSARSAPVGSDEVLGFVTSLLGIGVASVFASVVPVNDFATIPVMVSVHAALLKGATLPEAWLAARSEASGDVHASAAAASFVSWGA